MLLIMACLNAGGELISLDIVKSQLLLSKSRMQIIGFFMMVLWQKHFLLSRKK